MPAMSKLFMFVVIILIGTSSELVSAETVTYTYDIMQRLIRAQYSSGPAIEYVYDSMGNRTVRSSYAGGIPVNSPPNQAASPSPANGATGIGSPLTLSWSGSDPNPGDRLSYTVYSGTASNALKPVWSGSQTSFKPWALLANTLYYWKVVTRDSHNAETAGPVWSFTIGTSAVNGLPMNLDVSLVGSGSGSVTGINPTGIVCSGAPSDVCAQDLVPDSTVTLSAVASGFSRFTGWSVAACPAVQSYEPPFLLVPPPTCTFSMTENTAVSATFDLIPPVRVLLQLPYYPPLEMDSFATASGVIQSFGIYMQYSMIMQSHDRLFTEDVNINAGSQQVVWQGGYSGDYQAVTGTTRVQGRVNVQDGKLIVERIVIR